MYKRVVVKIGSNVLTRPDGMLDVTRMSALVDQVAELRHRGLEVVLVSSGAVASGRSELPAAARLDAVDQRQLYSAIGQVKLINRYYELFRDHHLLVGQVLTMKENFSTRRHYLNQRNCMEVMLANGVIPIVNENDTLSVTELMFTDNDELSGLVASMLNADALIILSNVDGIYDGPPNSPDSRVISEVAPHSDLSSYIQAEKSGFGRGGMLTKCHMALKVAGEGIEVIIANGRRDHILLDLLSKGCEVVCTRFNPRAESISSMKKWIAHSTGFAKGGIRLNARAVEAVCGNQAVSILPVGVVKVEGEFEKDDIIRILDEQGRQIGVGRSAYDSAEAIALMGQHGHRPFVHYDYLCLE